MSEYTYQTGTVLIGDLLLESGKLLKGAELRYELSGRKTGPVILVCHALTGSHLSVGTEKQPGWWRELIGPSGYINTKGFLVLTFNVLGGCDGSTGPASVNPETGEQYRMAFPELTVRDIVKAQYQALEELGVSSLEAVIGGSLGGMQALEWGLLYPSFVKKVFLLASTPYFSDYGIAFNTIGKTAIISDPNWREGKYERPADVLGLRVARMAGMVTYRSPELFQKRFNRSKASEEIYQVESYLAYQGEKLANRFDPNSYLYLMAAMNSHDIGRDRGGWKEAASQFQPQLIALGYTNDLIYPPVLIKEFAHLVNNSTYYEIETLFGHDGFLTEFDKWGNLISRHLEN
ncbi:homoserine O-acetyltransferase MetX [Bacillus sp. SG-1]|uniref:homoserine O-acetyltransferase MetX n=1 Tax=Bacillus sp. SG-1 TaxID=161544 RepID=UPI0001545586|nr:homoserine O-acetyltransferase [Bacillus sp. SG-1]EDL64602.1 homoserine O-acetyltransferase [Bacillus sp. SG-1]